MFYLLAHRIDAYCYRNDHQAAADMLGCSRSHLVKLLEEGIIPYTKVGRHRQVKLEVIMNEVV